MSPPEIKTEENRYTQHCRDNRQGSLPRVGDEHPVDDHEGKATHNGKKISYNKRQFYDRILTPMKAMGLVNYDMYKRTYSISKNFASAIQKIAEMWLEEYDKT